jgi:tetratricopeptide (TPR) repeat protein
MIVLGVGGCAARPAPEVFPESTQATRAEAWDPGLSAALAELDLVKTPGSHRHVAEGYRRLGVLDAAHTHFSAAIALDAKDAESFDARARIWRDWGFAHLGLGDAYRAIHHAPASAAPLNTLGTLLQTLGLRADARIAYEQALAVDPAASYALNNLCYLLLLDGAVEEGEATCRRALAMTPSLVAARNNLGLARALAGRLDEAEQEFRMATGPAAASYNMGMVYLAGGDFRRAMNAFHVAMRLEPSFDLAQARALQAGRLLRGIERNGPGDTFDHARH